MKLLIPSLLSLFLVACGNDSSTSVNNSDDERISYITDSRDGQKYKTVTIGSQIWMAQNLNYETENSWCGGGSTNMDNFYYEQIEGDCSKYGRHYTWAVAMDSAETWSTNGKDCGYNTACSPIYPVQGICPKGWHLPSQAEWITLFTEVGGKANAGWVLKSSSGWDKGGNGTDEFDFSALPAGFGGYSGEGYSAYFWSSTEFDGVNAYFVSLYADKDGAGLNAIDDFKDNGLSVRCLKD